MKLDHIPVLVKAPGLVRGFRLLNVANKALPHANLYPEGGNTSS